MAKKTVSPEHALYAKHTGHGQHLCELTAKREMSKVAKFAKGARYMCHICGRAAAKADHLCEPVEL
jgi:hypothetical protein